MFFILFYSVLLHLFCIKTCYSVIMDVTQKWPTAWLFENVLESDGKMNLRYDTYILTADYRAFSDLFGKFLVPMKLGKNCMILGKNMAILENNSAIFNKIGKVYLLNSDFSANWECSRSIGIFSANWEEIWYRKPDPVLYREKALD